MKHIVYTGPVPTNANGVPDTGFAGGGGGQSQFLLSLVQSIFTHSDATLQSANANVNGQPAYDLHVVPQGNATGTGVGSFNYNGEIYIDKETQLPLKLDLNVQGIGNVVVYLPKLELNPTLPASTLTFATPAGAKVLPLEQSSPQAGNGSLSFAQAQQQAGYHLLSIPCDQTDYMLEGVNALGAPGNQIYTLNYMQGNTSFTVAQGKPLANLPANSGQKISLRGTTAVLSLENGISTLAWTEKGIGVRITGKLSNEQILAIANLLV